jgi:hypothetical protein
VNDALVDLDLSKQAYLNDTDSMEILLPYESVRKVWGARDRTESRAEEHVILTGPSAKEAESWASQPGCRPERQPGKPE